MSEGLIEKLNPSTFEWTIPRFQNCIQDKTEWIRSPNFYQDDSIWYLSLHFKSDEWIGVFLWREDSGLPRTVTYSIRIKERTDVAEITRTFLFHKKKDYSGARMFLKKELARNWIFVNSFTILCCITGMTTHRVATERVFIVDRGVQTEVVNSVTEEENAKNDDTSSLGTRGVALLSQCMKELLIKGTEHDVTICVQDKKFRAHRSILSARSPVFAMMLTHDTRENNTSTINIEDCDPDSFDEFLLYVYSGKLENLTPSNALQLYYPADKYDFPILKEQCISILKTSLSVESICDVVLLATRHQEKELLKVATEFFARNVKKILVTVNWQKFMCQNPVEANELYIKSMDILHPEN